jgi:Ran GTPase-activating protein (RanGAP) involved in mRNA processing and transport
VLVEWLKVNRTITRLQLVGNFITDTGAQLLVDLLKENTTIIDIDISDNSLSQKYQDEIKQCLRLNWAKREIEKLKNPWDPITKLDWDHKKIMDSGVKVLVEWLKSNLTITRLKLGNNFITGAGAQFLFGFIQIEAQLLIFCR